MKKWFVVTSIIFLLAGCSKPVSSESTPYQEEPSIKQQILKSERIGSLTVNSANSPATFYDEVVNGRTQFINTLDNINDDTVQQTIHNDTNTITLVILWKKINPNEWESTKLTATLANKTDADSFQSFMRLPYRLKDSDLISKTMAQSVDLQGVVNSKLVNGAILTVIREVAGTRLIIE